ncbi:MAG: HAD superfamily hydrolase (TIGR01490 family) [Flavobacteriales bacterium]|jgi:HAD superfamily hydrolase (TIGR01490 family)
MDNNSPQVSESLTYAFFDVDDTLISVKSMFGFQDHWFSQHPDDDEVERFNKDMQRRHEKGISWEFLNQLYYSHFEGRDVNDVMACGKAWFEEQERSNARFYFTAIVDVLKRHQEDGCEPVFVSGSFPAVLNPIAKRLGVNTILSINMETQGNRYTGKILPPQTIGTGKAEAILNFLNEVGGKPEHCYAYGDDISDLPMLNTVGHPHVISGGRSLVEQTKDFGWPVLAPY